MNHRWEPRFRDDRLVAYKPDYPWSLVVAGPWRQRPRTPKQIEKAVAKCQRWCVRKNEAEDRIREAIERETR